MPLRPTLLRLKAAAVLTIAGAAALTLPAAAEAQQIYINTPVQMYAGPDLDYPIVATLHPGLGVEVNEELVIERSKTAPDWRNPVWRHADGAVAEW